MRDPLNALQWENGALWILDQRKLPGKIQWIEAYTTESVARAIETLAVRGAPAIGVAAGYGVALAGFGSGRLETKVSAAIQRLRRTRPTGHNLFHALDLMNQVLSEGGNRLPQNLLRQAIRIHRDDARACLAMASGGLRVFGKRERVLTYCHTGSLATGGIGTALGVIKHAFSKGKVAEVFACETRPVGQGARLTVWECARSGIPVTLICDNMAAALMQSGRVDRVLVGADRIARNGDASNKIGTLSIATLAKFFSLPFHVVAPTSTFDLTLRSGKDIIIEQRNPDEVARTIPGLLQLKGVKIWNPAFDVTPARLVTSFITDLGVIRPPFRW